MEFTVLVAIIAIFVVYLYTVYHCAKMVQDSGKRAKWIVLLIIFGVLVLPFYWWFMKPFVQKKTLE